MIMLTNLYWDLLIHKNDTKLIILHFEVSEEDIVNNYE